MSNNNLNDEIKYLEEERKNLWKRILVLEKTISEIKQKIGKLNSESLQDAAKHSRKAAEYRNKTETKFKEAESLKNEIASLKSKSEILKNDIEKLYNNADDKYNSLVKTETDFLQQRDHLNEITQKFIDFLNDHPDYEEELDSFNEFIKDIKEKEEKIKIIFANILTKKHDFDSLHNEIFGFKQVNLNGEETEIEGLRDKLKNSYIELSLKIQTMESNIIDLSKEYLNKYESFEKHHKVKYDSIIKTINGLLPGALTSGLSSAYAKKNNDELITLENHKKNFRCGILGLAISSILPIAITIFNIFNKVELNEALQNLPSLVSGILPLYIPLMWYTYSASKKVNLSKRLIEEYTHKEVLSKTFEGLSKQVENIDDKSLSKSLKNRLLTNFLDVSIENPGKLISDYKSNDHPIIEILEHSSKYKNALDKLMEIPGLKDLKEYFFSTSKKSNESTKDNANKSTSNNT